MLESAVKYFSCNSHSNSSPYGSAWDLAQFESDNVVENFQKQLGGWGVTLTLYLLERHIYSLQHFVLFCFCCYFSRKVWGRGEIDWVFGKYTNQSLYLLNQKTYQRNQPNPSEISKWLTTKHKRRFCLFSKTEAEKLPRGRDLSLGRQLTQ